MNFNFFSPNKGSDDGTRLCELKTIFPFETTLVNFIRWDIIQTYVKILTDVVERSHGLADKYQPSLWDNCVQSDAAHGLLTLLAHAMIDMSDLFLVFSTSTKVVRKATAEEASQIRDDYAKGNESKVGVYISFKGYRRTVMLKIYSELEYCVLSSLHKTVNISKAVQIRVNDLRASVSLKDSAVAEAQARAIASALERGRDVYLDAKDDIVSATPDTTATEKAIMFLDAKRSFILGLPVCYITGEQTAGMNSSGGADAKAIERGLKSYFVSIIQPVFKALYSSEVDFKSEDYDNLDSGLNAIKTFDLTSEEYMSTVAKQAVVQRLFDLDADEEKKNLAADAKLQQAQDAQDKVDAAAQLKMTLDAQAKNPIPAAQPPAKQGQY